MRSRTKFDRDPRPRRAGAFSDGFTLIELMVVIVIIAGLATIVGVNVLGALSDADRATAQAQIRTFSTALVTYKIQFNKFPANLEGLVNNSKNRNFLDSNTVPVDPWGNPYSYKSEGRNFTIVSYGEDGTPGGIEGDADISSDDLANK